jgi:hypothetical protein
MFSAGHCTASGFYPETVFEVSNEYEHIRFEDHRLTNIPIIFVEHWIDEDGYPLKKPGPYHDDNIDFPEFWYNYITKKLSGEVDFPFEKDLKMIYGFGHSLQGYAGGGCASMLYPVKKLPFIEHILFEPSSAEENVKKIDKGNIVIKIIGENGALNISYCNTNITLEVGEKWEEITAIKETNSTGVTQFVTTEVIINHGYIRRLKILRNLRRFPVSKGKQSTNDFDLFNIIED